MAAFLGYQRHPPRPPRADFPGASLVTAWSGWDGEWYHRIATQGYTFNGPNAQSPVAFFPAYPLAIRGLAAIGVNAWLAGALLSLLCGLAAVAVFHRWALRVSGDAPTATHATALLALYPFAFYLYGVLYSDGLFLLLALGAFLALEEDRVVLSTALGALATATRPVAPALVLGLLVRRFELRRRAGKSLTPLDALPVLASLGLLAYAAYLGTAFGDPLAFAHVQGAPGWDQPPGWHTWLKVSFVDLLSASVVPSVVIRFIGHAYITLLWLVLVFPTRKLLGWGYALYLLAAMAIPTLSSKDFMGLGRYALAGFPAFLTLALLMKDRPRLRTGWLAVTGAALVGLAYAFGSGAYVA
ncbi:MAG TPA: mannosyltransferase family protein [Myxococcales bacterium]|nr:mannosyltransferase family protein [Myxococcales bacterium]